MSTYCRTKPKASIYTYFTKQILSFGFVEQNSPVANYLKFSPTCQLCLANAIHNWQVDKIVYILQMEVIFLILVIEDKYRL